MARSTLHTGALLRKCRLTEDGFMIQRRRGPIRGAAGPAPPPESQEGGRARTCTSGQARVNHSPALQHTSGRVSGALTSSVHALRPCTQESWSVLNAIHGRA